MKLSLSKHQRLKSRKTIEQLFESGDSFYKYPIKLVFVEQEYDTLSAAKIAVTVSKRKFKSAVKRNLIKRRMREAFRRNQMEVRELLQHKKSTYAFMMIYVASKIEDYQTIEKGFLAVREKFIHSLKEE